MLICDFCNLPCIAWKYYAKPLKIIGVAEGEEVTVWSDDGIWAACDACFDLIETNAREALLGRALGNLTVLSGTHKLLKTIHDAFFVTKYHVTPHLTRLT